jgi:hypothetical protein
MKKVLLLGAILLIGTQAMANQGSSEKRFGNWTNKLTVTGAMQVNEDTGEFNWDGDAFGTSLEVDYALMYNITNRGRLGLELGYVNQDVKDGLKDQMGTSTIDSMKLGIIGEYDVYSKDNTTIYLTGSFGAQSGSVTTTTINYPDKGEFKLETVSYVKLGVGATYKAFLVETGVQGVAYKANAKANGIKAVDDETIVESEIYLSVGIKL